MTKKPAKKIDALDAGYASVLEDLTSVIHEARSAAARTVNSAMTAAYWLIGRRIVEHDQAGQARAAYGEEMLVRLADDLTQRFGRGFSRQNLQQMRQFYLAYPSAEICQTVSGKSGPIRKRDIGQNACATCVSLTNPFPWCTVMCKTIESSAPHSTCRKASSGVIFWPEVGHAE